MSKDNAGALFQAKKSSDKAPDYTGECVIGGTKYRIAGWRNTSARGTPYLSLKFQDDAKPAAEPDEDIPF